MCLPAVSSSLISADLTDAHSLRGPQTTSADPLLLQKSSEEVREFLFLWLRDPGGGANTWARPLTKEDRFWCNHSFTGWMTGDKVRVADKTQTLLPQWKTSPRLQREDSEQHRP